MLRIFLFSMVMLSGCSIINSNTKNLKIFNGSDSLEISYRDSLSFKEIYKNIKETTHNSTDKIWIQWSVKNLSNKPTNVQVISRTLYDYNLTYYVFDSINTLKEKKNIYWGMPYDQREVNTYIPIKSIFFDSQETLNIVVSIKKALRSNHKLHFEITTKKTDSEVTIRKFIDAIFSAILLLNIISLLYFIFKYKTENKLWSYYFFYNILALIAFSLRYFSAYFSPIEIPEIFNLIVEYFMFGAAFCYFCFGLQFIEYDKVHFLKMQQFAFCLISICLISLMPTKLAFHPIIIFIRFTLLIVLLVKFYHILYLSRHKVYSKIFLYISVSFLLMSLFNAIYSNFYFFNFQNIYGLEFIKIIIIIESILLFSGLIFRQNIKNKS